MPECGVIRRSSRERRDSCLLRYSRVVHGYLEVREGPGSAIYRSRLAESFGEHSPRCQRLLPWKVRSP
jgi:hypothetical protein